MRTSRGVGQSCQTSQGLSSIDGMFSRLSQERLVPERHMRSPVVLTLLVTLPGCASVQQVRYHPTYEYVLVEVQRPTKAKERYGDQAIASVQDSGVTKYSFEDQ